MKTLESVIERKKNSDEKWLPYTGMKWMDNDTLIMPILTLEQFVAYEKSRMETAKRRGYTFRLIIRTTETEIKTTDEVIL
jgi:hypothetical protein